MKGKSLAAKLMVAEQKCSQLKGAQIKIPQPFFE